MRQNTPSDVELLTALRRMWEHRDPPPVDLDEVSLGAVERAELVDDLVVLELLADADAFANVRGDGGRTLRFASGGFEVLLRVERETEGFRIDGWSVPAHVGEVRIEVNGHVEVTTSDAVGRFAFTSIAHGTAAVSLAAASDDAPPVWTTAAFLL